MKTNKMFAILMVVMMALTMAVSAYGETIKEEIKTEDKIVETILAEEIIREEYMTDEGHKRPNYVITIGGDQIIDVEVDHHPKFIQAIGTGCKWVGAKITDGVNKVRSIFTTKEDK